MRRGWCSKCGKQVAIVHGGIGYGVAEKARQHAPPGQPRGTICPGSGWRVDYSPRNTKEVTTRG